MDEINIQIELNKRLVQHLGNSTMLNIQYEVEIESLKVENQRLKDEIERLANKKAGD